MPDHEGPRVGREAGSGRRLAELRQALVPVTEWFEQAGVGLGHLWRRSLQLRVIVSTLTLSLIVITVLGVVLTSQITDRLLDAKINAAVEEMDRARNTVQSQLAGVHDISSQQQRLADARDALSSRGSGGQAGGAAGSFDSALSMVGGTRQQQITVGPIEEVPAELRRFVQRNQVSYQFTTVSDSDGYEGRALIIGSPSAEVPTLETYLIFPLTNEERSLALMRGTMMVGGLVLLVLLAAITALVTRQVVLPIRSAARIAGRFADGRLKERMLVRGEDDMARLAEAFNEMAESLSNQITQLEEFGNLQRRFTSDVSHELRTPLTTVRMAADLIHGSSEDLDPALARSAELLVTELDRFEGLLNDLLEISRHDAGVAELQVESLDVRMCVRAAIATVRHLAKESGVEVVVDLPEEPVVAEVDPRRVERVLRNLTANAIDHSEGKPVLVRMRGDSEANAVAVVVRDQGVGLRPGEEKLVFSRFWRSDPSRMRRSGGTGLGLSISQEDANLHEGKLEAWGEVGVGASFRLTLPLVRGRKLGKSPLPLEPVRKAPRRPVTDAELEAAGSTVPALKAVPDTPDLADSQGSSAEQNGPAPVLAHASENDTAGSAVLAAGDAVPAGNALDDPAAPDDSSTPPEGSIGARSESDSGAAPGSGGVGSSAEPSSAEPERDRESGSAADQDRASGPGVVSEGGAAPEAGSATESRSDSDTGMAPGGDAVADDGPDDSGAPARDGSTAGRPEDGVTDSVADGSSEAQRQQSGSADPSRPGGPAPGNGPSRGAERSEFSENRDIQS